MHRDGDLPAVISARGDLEYWKNGRRHRDNGPARARIIKSSTIKGWSRRITEQYLTVINMEYVKEYWGITEYYKNGVLHRDGDLPAVISARGDLEYWKNGRRHRDNGPAIIRKDGVCSWYKNGVHLVTC